MIEGTMQSIDSISNQYKAVRLKNKLIEQERQEEIYSKFPRVKEIEDEIGNARFELIRLRLNGRDTAKEKTKEVKEKTSLLQIEKVGILCKNGYPSDYLDPIYDCKLCEDTGNVDGKRCSCFSKKIIANLYKQSNLDKILERENFSTFDISYYSKDVVEGKTYTPYDNMTRILEKSHSFIDNFSYLGDSSRKCDVKPNLFLYGAAGRGKTFLTNCIAKELLDQGYSVLYLSANELFENIIGAYIIGKDSSMEYLYKLLYSCDLLIIDDLGTEYVNDFTKTQLFEVINKRLISNKSVLISTNFNIKDFRTFYSERIASRIIDNYTVFNFYGDNIRYHKRFNGVTNV